MRSIIFYIIFSVLMLLAILTAYLSFLVNNYFRKLLLLYSNVTIAKA